jgi:hypothetical protein
MRLTRIAMFCLGLGLVAACSDDKLSAPTLPPLAGVRFINAVADTGAVDIRMIDQVDYTPTANNLNFRSGTEHQPAEAKARHIRVFPNSLNEAITQNYLLDTTITIQANTRITLLLTGSARAKTLKFVTINDDITAPAAGTIGVRLVNAGTGAVNGYLVDTTTTPIADPAAASNVAVLGQSPYVNRNIGKAAVRVTDVGSATVNASGLGPIATVLTGANPAAGVNSAGTKFSVYYFPRGVAGSPQNAVATPTVTWFVDRNPAEKQ